MTVIRCAICKLKHSICVHPLDQFVQIESATFNLHDIRYRKDNDSFLNTTQESLQDSARLIRTFFRRHQSHRHDRRPKKRYAVRLHGAGTTLIANQPGPSLCGELIRRSGKLDPAVQHC